MKLEKKLSIVFLIVIICISNVSWVLGEQLSFSEDYSFDVAQRSWYHQEHTFYSNYTNRFYNFFVTTRQDYPAGLTECYVSSHDGINWYERQYTGYFEHGGGMQEYCLDETGRYLYKASIDDDSGHPYTVDYWCWELLMNGSLRLIDFVHEIPLTGMYGQHEPHRDVSIMVDNETRPYIAFEAIIGPGYTYDECWLLRCGETNGSWITTTSVNFQSVYANVNDEEFFTKLVPTGDGKTVSGRGRGVHWIVLFDAIVSFGQSFYHVGGINYYDGNGWDWKSLNSVSMNDNENQWEYKTWDVAWCGNVTVLIKQIENIYTPDRKRLDYCLRIGKNAWQNKTAVSFTIPGDTRGDGQFWCNVGMDGDYDAVFTFGIFEPVGNKSMWYAMDNVMDRATNATWDWDIPYTFWQNTTSGTNFNEQSPCGGSGFLPYNVPHSVMWTDTLNDDVWHDYLFPITNGELQIPYIYYNTTLYNSDGSLNDGWIFRGETYKFESYFMGATTFELNFTDGQHDIRFSYSNSTQTLSIDSDDQFVIGDYYLNITTFPLGIIRTTWGFIPNTNIVDDEGVTVSYTLYNAENNVTVTGTTGVSFNIYNLGGFTYYDFTGDGGKTPYGTSTFDIYATNGSKNSWARAEQIYRKLQHVSFLIEIDMDQDWSVGNGAFDIHPGAGWVDIGFDYRLNGTWVNGTYIKLYVQDADVGHHNAGNDHNWVEWSVDFYNYDPSYGQTVNKRSQLIYSNHWGYENENLSPDYHNRTSSQLWIDIWFDRTNASTTTGVQVNSYYYGMREHGSSWWFGYGVFQPMISDYDNAKFLDDLYDEGGNVTNCQKIDLVKFFVEVGKVDLGDHNNETWRIRGIEDMHRELALDRMEGIDEPTFTATKVLDMPQTGFLNAIKSAIQNIANVMLQGLFFTMKSVWAGVGYIMELMGLKTWYDALSAMIENIASISIQIMAQLEIALLNSAELLEQIFRMISNGLTRWTYGITQAITSLLSWYQGIVQIFTGGGIFSINIWMSLSMGDWFMLGVHLLPVWWVNRLAKADDILRTAQGDISFALMLITGLFNFLSTVIILAISLFNFILGLLPI